MTQLFDVTSDAIIVDDLPGLTLKNVTVYTDVATNISTNRAIQATNSATAHAAGFSASFICGVLFSARCSTALK